MKMSLLAGEVCFSLTPHTHVSLIGILVVTCDLTLDLVELSDDVNAASGTRWRRSMGSWLVHRGPYVERTSCFR